ADDEISFCRRRRNSAVRKLLCRDVSRRVRIARRRCGSRALRQRQRRGGGEGNLECTDRSLSVHRSSVRLLLERERVQRIAGADDDVLTAIEQVRLWTVA